MYLILFILYIYYDKLIYIYVCVCGQPLLSINAHNLVSWRICVPKKKLVSSPNVDPSISVGTSHGHRHTGGSALGCQCIYCFRGFTTILGDFMLGSL